MAETLVIIPRSRATTDLKGNTLESYPSPLIADRISVLKPYFEKQILIAGWHNGRDEVVHGEGYEYHKVRMTDRSITSKIRYLSRVIQVLRSEEDAVVLNFDPNLTGALIGLAVKATETKLVTKFIGLPEQDPGRFGKSRLGFTTLLAISDTAITISPYCEERLRCLYDREIQIVTNRVRPDFRQLDVEPIPNSVLYVGRFDPEKRIALLLKAFAELTDIVEDTTLLLVGDESDEHRKLAASLNILDQTEFVGHVPRTEIPQWMNKATVFAYPTKEEAFGMALLEAMACGTPVVGADSGSIPWVVGDGGEIVDPQDSEQFARTLAEIMVDDKYRKQLANQGLKRASDFQYETWGDELAVAIEDFDSPSN